MATAHSSPHLRAHGPRPTVVQVRERDAVLRADGRADDNLVHLNWENERSEKGQQGWRNNVMKKEKSGLDKFLVGTPN